MRYRFFTHLIIALSMILIPTASSHGQGTGTLDDELMLRAASLPTDGPSLREFFRKRTIIQADPKKVRQLIQDLGHESIPIRETASAELVSLGPLAVPWLRLAAKDADNQEVTARALRCLHAIEGMPNRSVQTGSNPASPNVRLAPPDSTGQPATVTTTPIAISAARLLAQRRPEGAADVLLAYLPFADSDNVMEEVKAALLTLAIQNGKPDAALIRALEDKLALRRVVAGEVLCQTMPMEALPLVRKLLKDAKPVVRLRMARAMADLKEAEAITALIDLLTELPLAEAQVAEDYLLSMAGDRLPGVPLGTDPASRQKCREAWSSWWNSKQGPALLEDLRKRTLTDADWEKARQWIQKLGDDSFAVREKATAELQTLGSPILPLIRQAANNPDLEVSRRAGKVLEVLDKEKTSPLSALTIRLLAYRRPAGVVEALLSYLPLAEEETLLVEARASLAEVAAREGSPDPALVQALSDKLAVRRGAAAEALCRAGMLEQVPVLRKLLQDPDMSVRLQSALAMAGAGDKQAVPVLIALLGTLPPDQGIEAEEFLSRVAGEQAPNVRLGKDPAERQKVEQAWLTWWRMEGRRVDSTRLQNARQPFQRQLGFTLLILADNGEVLEIGRDGKPRWQLTSLQGPTDAQVLPNGRVLVAESQAGRVSERSLKNEIVWEKRINWPIGCQRLPNGNTFIVTRNQLLEVDRSGREVFTYNRPFHDITAAQKLRDGQMICATSSGLCLRIDGAGKELKSFRIMGALPLGSIDALPSGRVLIPQTWANKVTEYDLDGKLVWEASVQQPVSAVRLMNGHTLVASQTWPPKVMELDRGGKTVWEQQPANRATRARRR